MSLEKVWQWECGPCDDSTEEPITRVGLAANLGSQRKSIKPEENAEALKTFCALGRVDKDEIDFSWDSSPMTYNVYGKSEGADEARGITEANIEATSGEGGQCGAQQGWTTTNGWT